MSEQTMEKQIKEMAKVLCEDCAKDPSPCPLTESERMCDAVLEQAEALYNAGYRKQHRGVWIDLGDQRCQCSECGAVRYGNSKACILEYHLAPFCEKCGALLCDLTSE